MYKTFVFGVVLGLASAGGLAYSVKAVDLEREFSHISVRANGGNLETFRINLPRDRIMVGLAGADSTLPAGLNWPGPDVLGGLQAEMFKVRDRNNVVIGANAVVITDVPDDSIAVGVPAIIKPRRTQSTADD